MKLSIHPNYRNIYYLTYVLNIVIGLYYAFNSAYAYGFNTSSILLLILFSIISLIILIFFFIKRKIINKLDLLFMWTYIAYIIIFFILSLYYQSRFIDTYNIMYFKDFIIGPYIIFLIHGFLVEKGKKHKKNKD